MKTSGEAIAIGAGVGVALGVAMGNIALGIALGVAIGAAFTVSRNKKGTDDSSKGDD